MRHIAADVMAWSVCWSVQKWLNRLIVTLYGLFHIFTYQAYLCVTIFSFLLLRRWRRVFRHAVEDYSYFSTDVVGIFPTAGCTKQRRLLQNYFGYFYYSATFFSGVTTGRAESTKWETLWLNGAGFWQTRPGLMSSSEEKLQFYWQS